LGELRLLPGKVQRVLDMTEDIKKISQMLASYENIFFIGKGISYPVALEGALKLKEIAYIHAEGYPAGELKHGPFALLDKNTPVIAILPKDETYRRMFSTIKEIKARGAPVIVISNFDNDDLPQLVDSVLTLPSTEPMFSPVIQSVALQLLAYFCACERGYPVDRPRNLAKSVTVY
jgi:glucosamine--fructose-6-phosphate aminotransferase (isomerizing)